MRDYINLYHLNYFLEVVNLRSYSRAAEKLNISQPALSKSVKNLEETLGVKLISFANQKLSLTEAGEQFERAARLFFQHYDELLNSTNSSQDIISGTVKIGMPAALIDVVFGDAAKKFITQYSNIGLNVIDGDTSLILDEIGKGRMDLGIVMLSSSLPSGVEIFPLLHNDCYVVLNKTHTLASEEKIGLSKLAGEKFLIAGELSSLFISFKNMCEHIGIHPNIIFQGMSPKVFIDIISQGDAVTVFPLPLIETYKNDDIVWRPLEPHLEWNIALVAPSDRRISSAATFVKDYLIEYYSQRKQ